MSRIFLMLALLIMTGCAYDINNLASRDQLYYKKNLSESENTKQLKKFYADNNIKYLGIST
jgi:hypothetical protein